MTTLAAAFHLPQLRKCARRLQPLLRFLPEGWRLVAIFAGAATLLAALALRVLPPEHTASMVVGPIARSGASAMGARAPVTMRSDMPLSVLEFGNGDEMLSDFARFIELLTSPTVAARLMAEPGILPHLFPERWDQDTGRWHTPGGLGGWLRGVALALAGRADWSAPDADLVSRHLRRSIVVQLLGNTPMRRISYHDSDRAFAVKLLQRLTAAADAQLREEAIRRANAQIDYIRARLTTAQSADSRKALVELLNDQERVATMIGVDLPYAADPIEPPSASSQPDWPNPLIVMPLATTAGAGLGLFLVFARRSWQDSLQRPFESEPSEDRAPQGGLPVPRQWKSQVHKQLRGMEERREQIRKDLDSISMMDISTTKDAEMVVASVDTIKAHLLEFFTFEERMMEHFKYDKVLYHFHEKHHESFVREFNNFEMIYCDKGPHDILRVAGYIERWLDIHERVCDRPLKAFITSSLKA